MLDVNIVRPYTTPAPLALIYKRDVASFSFYFALHSLSIRWLLDVR